MYVLIIMTLAGGNVSVVMHDFTTEDHCKAAAWVLTDTTEKVAGPDKPAGPQDRTGFKGGMKWACVAK